VRTTSPNLVIDVTNVTKQSVELRGVSITGRAKGDYYEYNTCGKSLNSQGSVQRDRAVHSPTRKGTRKADIAINVDQQGASSKHASITGSGS
jgi:hypothetical protein